MGCKRQGVRFHLKSRSRGCNLITREIEKQVSEIEQYKIGMANIFRKSFSRALNKIVPENLPYVHTAEGPDDMPGHVKYALVGASLNIPITNGKFNLGTWQGIWLCEHRTYSFGRRVVVTLQGEKKA
ncbi:hypothetical protein C1645_796115 [Glomus cerebriforme]|uniref:Uncharacterized protein n=1 Tax=Glomus cerebriforme TaxID=658196 RepID=A0A397TET5_9GLOM|nr:hypothetical protein C1645_796115 [Glomus cerebriforme]